MTAKQPRRRWTEAEKEYVAQHYANELTENIAKIVGRPVGSVYQLAQALGLKKSTEFLRSPESGRLRRGEYAPGSEKGWFKKGQSPKNKGLRRPGYGPGRMKETQFRPGNRTGMAARNYKPVGTILPDTDGYLRIKVRDAKHGEEATGFGNTKVWPLYSRWVWEQANGPIPPKHMVIFRDGNRKNCAIENLELISRSENARRNVMWNRYPRDLAENIQLLGAAKRRIRTKERKSQ